MILDMDGYRIYVQFRHRWFVRPGRHMMLHDMQDDLWDANEVGWRELAGDRTIESNFLLAGLLRSLSHMLEPICGREPVHVARGTVCHLYIAELPLQEKAGVLVCKFPMLVGDATAFAVCRWDPDKGKREMFVKSTGRRESLAKALAEMRRRNPDVAGRLVELGLLDKVCPVPPPKPAYVRPTAQDGARNAGDKPMEIQGELRVSH